MVKPRIDPTALHRYLDAGHSQADAARQFGVSEAAISQRLRKLRGLTSRVVALERAGEVVDQKIDATARLQRAQEIIDDELAWAVDQAQQPGADRRACRTPSSSWSARSASSWGCSSTSPAP